MGSENSGWIIDKRINLGALLSLMTSLVLLAGLAADMGARLDMAEKRVVRVENYLDEVRATAVKVERIEERILGIQGILLEIKEELRSRGGG